MDKYLVTPGPGTAHKKRSIDAITDDEDGDDTNYDLSEADMDAYTQTYCTQKKMMRKIPLRMMA